MFVSASGFGSVHKKKLRRTFELLAAVRVLQLQLLQSGRQVFLLLGRQVAHGEAVVVEQQSQPLQGAL